MSIDQSKHIPCMFCARAYSNIFIVVHTVSPAPAEMEQNTGIT